MSFSRFDTKAYAPQNNVGDEAGVQDPADGQRLSRKDLDVFFYPWCASGVKLPEKVQEEIAELCASALVADYRKTLGRWAKVGRLIWRHRAIWLMTASRFP
jgi:hypothetical protein